MPAGQSVLRLKTAIQGCQKAFKNKETQNFAKGLFKGREASSNLSLSSSPSGVCGRSTCRFTQSKKRSEESIERGKILSMSETLSRTIPVTSAQGLSRQACECTHSSFVNNGTLSFSKDFYSPRRVAISVSVRTLTSARKGHARSFTNSLKCSQRSEYHTSRSIQGGGNGQRVDKKTVILNLAHDLFALNSCNTGNWFRWILGSTATQFYSSFASVSSARATPEITFDGAPKDENPEDSSNASEQALLGDRTLKLLSGACYLPHPEKEDTGGEDAHFICVDEQAIGVADGVGGWALQGVNAGEYARELMAKAAAAIQEEPKGSIDLLRVLEKAYMSTKSRGSSTACMLALTEKGLHAINLGDSGFLVVRDGCTVFKSPVQQHDFNFTYQLESGDGSDLPSSAQVFNLQVAPGDVIIAGTDGLFDNLYNSEVTGVVVHAVRAGLGPQITAQKIAALARQRAQDTHRQTPFSTAAQDAGFRYYGGKLDDITVVVSYVSSSSGN
eukprot:TRINITY_DN703_c0_g1_i1.p1 TRINITY_DN703_c0_g1~~TRINITY_DN703_c0_g1_i1.p1  ORF type:complete len:501 (+),score=92.33 TRINITY_DN703_c0_g1_i1:366-1868(+)